MAAEPHYGQQIRSVRKAHGLTQEEFARKAGIAINSLRRYESNERQPTLETIEKMAAVVGLSLSDFLWQDSVKSGSYYWSAELEDKLKGVDCSLQYDANSGKLKIGFSDGMLEVTEDDLRQLDSNSNVFMRFLLSDLRKKREEVFCPKKEGE